MSSSSSPLVLWLDKHSYDNQDSEELLQLIETNQWKGLDEFCLFVKNRWNNNKTVGVVLNERFSLYLRKNQSFRFFEVLFASSLVSYQSLNEYGLIHLFAKNASSIPAQKRIGLIEKLQSFPDAPPSKDFWLNPLTHFQTNYPLLKSKSPQSKSAWIEFWVKDKKLQETYLSLFKKAGLTPTEAFEKAYLSALFYGIKPHQGYLWNDLKTEDQQRFWINLGLLKTCPPMMENLKPPPIIEKNKDHTIRPKNEEGCVNLIWQGPFPENIKDKLTLDWFENALSRTHLKEARRWMKLLTHQDPTLILDFKIWLHGFESLAYKNHNPCDWKNFFKLHQEAYEQLEQKHPLRKSHESLERIWKVLMGSFTMSKSYIHHFKSKELAEMMEKTEEIRPEDAEQLLEILKSLKSKDLMNFKSEFILRMYEYMDLNIRHIQRPSASSSKNVNINFKPNWIPNWAEPLSSIEKKIALSSISKLSLIEKFIETIACQEVFWKPYAFKSIELNSWKEEDWEKLASETNQTPPVFHQLFDLVLNFDQHSNLSSSYDKNQTKKSLSIALSNIVYNWVMHGLNWEATPKEEGLVLEVMNNENKKAFEYQLQSIRDKINLEKNLPQTQKAKASSLKRI